MSSPTPLRFLLLLAETLVLQALLLTAVSVLSLTAFTFHAARQGYTFEFLGPALFTSLMLLIFLGIIQASYCVLRPPTSVVASMHEARS